MPDVRPRVVVQSAAGPIGGWLDRLAARPDVEVDRIDSRAPLVRAARDAKLVVLVATFPLPTGDEVSLFVRLRELHGELPLTPAVVLLQCDDAPEIETAAARDALFAAGATDVVFLPSDVDRLDDAIGQFAGIGARRYVRHRVRVAATIRDGDRETAVQVENLSAGGVQIRLGRTPAIGDVVKLSIPLERKMALECWGIVRNIAAGGQSSVARLRFVGMRANERVRLDSFLASLDADTRSTEPADAIAGVRRFDANSLRAALAEPGSIPDWLTASIPALSDAERRALGAASPSGAAAIWVQVAVARTQAFALADALEKYDPSLDGESGNVRETVLGVMNRLAGAQAELGAGDAEARTVGAAMEEVSSRLRRAVAARLPDLSAAWERGGRRALSVNELGLSDLTVRQFDRPRLRSRLVAAGAGVVLGGAIVYAVVATVTRATQP